MDSKSGELRFLTRLSQDRFEWKSRCKLVWVSKCGKVIRGSRSHDFYIYENQPDYDRGRLCGFFKSLGEAKRFFILRELHNNEQNN